MKRIALLFSIIFILHSSVFAYDFYFTSPSGHTLYYRIISGNNVYVTWQNTSSPRYTNLSGSVIIPATVSYGGNTYNVIGIDNNAFEHCWNLTAITIPNSISTIGIESFDYCNSLSTIIWGNSVQSIGNSAFRDCSALSSITIPNSVVSIGNNSFQYCTAATSISIGSSVTMIGESAFMNCSGVTSLTIGSSVSSIGNDAFDGCIGITSISIPISVNYIGASAFYGCTGLSHISYGGSMTDWLNITFGGTYSNPVIYSRSLHIGDSIVRSVIVPEGTTSIKYNTFCGMDSLISIRLPNSLVTIDHYAFYGCSGLPNIEIPSSVHSIGYRAFEGCVNIDTIVCKRTTPPTCLSDSPYHTVSVFSGVPLNARIIVPCHSENAYSNASGWNYFVNFESNPVSPQIEVTSSDTTMGSTQYFYLNDCMDSIAIIATAAAGFHFDHWSNGETSNPYYFSLNENSISIVAYFDTNIFHVITEANPTEGITTGDTIIIMQDNASVTISAEPNAGYLFVQWSDGNTNNPRVVSVVSDTTLRAFFAENVNHCQVSLSTNNEYWGGVFGGGNYVEGDSVCCFAQPFDGYAFLGWSNGSQENPLCFRVYSNVSLVALFIDTLCPYSVNLSVNDITMGGTTGGGQYQMGDTAICTAIPFDGYSFRGWSNGSQDNPLTFVVTSNVDLMAIFIESVGIDECDTMASLKIYPNPAESVVTLSLPHLELPQLISIYDAVGRVVKRIVATSNTVSVKIDNLSQGIYHVHIGGHTKRLIIR